MEIISFEGEINSGQIKLPPNLNIPDKTKVYIIIPNIKIKNKAFIDSPRLTNPKQAADFKKEIIEVK